MGADAVFPAGDLHAGDDGVADVVFIADPVPQTGGQNAVGVDKKVLPSPCCKLPPKRQRLLGVVEILPVEGEIAGADNAQTLRLGIGLVEIVVAAVAM